MVPAKRSMQDLWFNICANRLCVNQNRKRKYQPIKSESKKVRKIPKMKRFGLGSNLETKLKKKVTISKNVAQNEIVLTMYCN